MSALPPKADVNGHGGAAPAPMMMTSVSVEMLCLPTWFLLCEYVLRGIPAFDPKRTFQFLQSRMIGMRFRSCWLYVPGALEEMSLHDYVMLLRFQGTWSRFAEAFGKNQDMAAAKLAPLPRIRNNVFHFRRDLTLEEYDTLSEPIINRKAGERSSGDPLAKMRKKQLGRN